MSPNETRFLEVLTQIAKSLKTIADNTTVLVQSRVKTEKLMVEQMRKKEMDKRRMIMETRKMNPNVPKTYCPGGSSGVISES